MLCIITSIIVAVVRLSRFAEMINVARVIVHSRRLEFLVLIHFEIKSKQPLLLSSSTIDIVAKRKSTMAAALPT